ncbi:hypothetical protein T4A_474 [Trichinella pseudospiralis]|uniref:Uncharacterized protein n=1 Tax=Trichinella pseudospiralis TaxID=6337 RepID=A0A0V1AMB3_TRIPS|nr:hypothetical protein T4A_474 [Trichinella pseudospiralis]
MAKTLQTRMNKLYSKLRYQILLIFLKFYCNANYGC